MKLLNPRKIIDLMKDVATPDEEDRASKRRRQEPRGEAKATTLHPAFSWQVHGCKKPEAFLVPQIRSLKAWAQLPLVEHLYFFT